MSSASGQPQFRYTQPPSKVLHVRNLPWECTEGELIELGTPFGKVINTKCGVGANRNQAFIEFAEINQAIAMISYYASSAEPAQVRGKTVYLQYSNRQEIVFSAFGFVHKIATFEKTAGFQALIQFSDTETATSAKISLDGRSIPRYLLQEHVGQCSLRITYSAHRDLNVKFQSHRSRDYTNPYLPVASSAIDGSGQFGLGTEGKKQEPESNVLLASIEDMQFAVSIDVLHTIAIFEKNAGFQALIQYPDIPTATAAKNSLEGHCIYDGGFCRIHLAYSCHTDLNIQTNNDRGRDYTIQGSATPGGQPSILGHQPHPSLEPVGSQYGGVPQASAFGGMGHRLHPGGWEVGTSHMHGQMYAFPGACRCLRRPVNRRTSPSDGRTELPLVDFYLMLNPR
ncbi:unnamed protein product [Spirodela intermedia]|uniref:RRM domain-containing protein n=1 Tax=Spirodela intermedia TaxID=51605 RepID=A0A7I8J8X0_SPIIN|nr:unnamed protein product [Spirodela intermedia]CAA6665873.1 unnamed protein product [Spirodela intermedia]